MGFADVRSHGHVEKMKRLAFLAIIGISGYAVFAQTAKPGEVVVHMTSDSSDYRFEPANITIKVGTTVKWINDSSNRHTATDDPNFEKKAGEAEMPNGAEPWTSPFLTGGESFSQTFKVPGKYRYFCRNHGQFGMEGTITVE